MVQKMAFLLLTTVMSASVYAAQYTLGNGDIVGEVGTATARKGDTLNRLAIRHGLGYNEMVRANPKWRGRKIPSGTTVTLPTKHQLPGSTRQGIVINVSAMRLFYYPPGGGKVITYPIAVGKRGWSTPTGSTRVVAKHRNPTWTPPASIRKEAAKKGRKLKKVYPAGPNNPLGTRAIRLGMPGYLIHGTNKPWSIGKRASHGCIRMRKGDVERLYSMVSVNTPVTIVSEKNRLRYPASPAKSTDTYVKSKSKARKSPTSKTVAKRRAPAPKRVNSGSEDAYLRNNELDFSRLQDDIQSGESRPIDLSDI